MTAPAVDAPATPAAAAPSAPAISADPIGEAIAAARAAAAAPPVAAIEAPAAGAPVEGDPTAPGEPDPNAPPVEGEPPVDAEPPVEPIVVALPGRRPGDPDMEIEVSDPQVAERIQNALRSYERKADSTARYQAAERLRQEADEFLTMVQINPTQVVADRLSPERQAYLALQLLTSDQLWPALEPHVAGLLNDDSGQTRRLIVAELRAEGLRLQQQAAQQIEGQRAADRNAGQVRRAIEAIVPPSLTGGQRDAWAQDALAAVAQYVEQHNLQSLHPMDLPMVLAGRLRAWNTDPQAAAAHLHATMTGRRNAPSGEPAPSRPAAPTGPQLVRAAAMRREAAAAAPAGGHAPPAQAPQMPATAKVEDAINFRRAQLGLAPR